MAQKKIASQPLGELLNLRVPSIDQEKILAAVDGLPPIFFWNQATNNDQKQNFSDTKLLFQALKREMELYFSGQGSEIPLLPKKDQAAMGAMLDRELAWYGVVQMGWQYIEDEFSKNGISLEAFGISTPGDALINRLGRLSNLAMSESESPYYVFSPSAERRFNREESKVQRGEADEKLLAKVNAVAKKKNAELKPYMALPWYLIQICEQKAKRNKALSRRIKALRLAQGNVEAEANRYLHERNKLKGVVWRNGKKSGLAGG